MAVRFILGRSGSGKTSLCISSIIDVLARRTPLARLDTAATRLAVPRVLEIMAEELGWEQQRCEEEICLTEKRLAEGL